MSTATDTTKTAQAKRGGQNTFVQGVHGVRYQVKDVARSVAFYTTHLGFTLGHQQLPAFANQRLARRRADSAQRSTSVGISTDAKRPAAGTRRMESCCATRQRSSSVYRDPEKSGPAFSK